MTALHYLRSQRWRGKNLEGTRDQRFLLSCSVTVCALTFSSLSISVLQCRLCHFSSLLSCLCYTSVLLPISCIRCLIELHPKHKCYVFCCIFKHLVYFKSTLVQLSNLECRSLCSSLQFLTRVTEQKKKGPVGTKGSFKEAENCLHITHTDSNHFS